MNSCPFSSSTSSGSQCSAKTAPLQVSTGLPTLAPAPALLNVSTPGPLTVPPQINLRHLQPSMLTFPLMLPPLNTWLSRLSKPEGGCRDSTVDTRLIGKSRQFDEAMPDINRDTGLPQNQKRARTNSGVTDLAPPKPAPPPKTTLSQFKTAALCIHNSALMKSGQQLRDEELQRGLEPFLPTVLMEIVRNYAPELVLKPFDIDKYAQTISNGNNTEILHEFIRIFGSGVPGSELFQNEIVENHTSKVLDPLFRVAVPAVKNRNTLAAIVSNQAGALQRRQRDFRVITNYLPSAQSEQMLRQEVADLARDHACPDDCRKQMEINIRLFIEALHNANPASEQIRKRQSLEYGQADLLLRQANAHINNRNTAQGLQLIQKSLEIFCRLKEKRRVSEILIQLFDLSEPDRSGNFQEALQFFDTAQKLCVTYPADFDLFAELMFEMDKLCQDHLQFAVLQKLYRQVLIDPKLMFADRYAAKLDRKSVV